MMLLKLFKKILFYTIFVLALSAPSGAHGALTASNAFTLIKKLPPGLEFKQAVNFLGKQTSEKLIEEETQIKISRWEVDGWAIDLLHDGQQVRAARVSWLTKSKGDMSRIFSGLTHSGKEQFGRAGVFRGNQEATWKEMDGNWLIVASYGDQGVSLLSAIRGKVKDSSRYGF